MHFFSSVTVSAVQSITQEHSIVGFPASEEHFKIQNIINYLLSINKPIPFIKILEKKGNIRIRNLKFR